MFTVTTFYKFIPLTKENMPHLQSDCVSIGKELHLNGLILLAEEGVNATIAGSAESIASMKEYIEKQFGTVLFKDSPSEGKPFKRFLVKIRDEIVAIGKPTMHPENEEFHISPSKWNEMIEQEDVVVLDARNTYETRIGIFEGAIDPKLSEFDEFPTFVKECFIPKTKKVLMYCTGGIRCEKALLEMRNQGYENVYQLKGGILQYLKEYPNKYFHGECFVFDHRAAVNQNLEPSTRYTLCPHCGDPGDRNIICNECSDSAIICEKCLQRKHDITCSKNCEYHYQRKHQNTVLS